MDESLVAFNLCGLSSDRYVWVWEILYSLGAGLQLCHMEVEKF